MKFLPFRRYSQKIGPKWFPRIIRDVMVPYGAATTYRTSFFVNFSNGWAPNGAVALL